MVSPLSSTPAPPAPPAQWTTALPAKCPPHWTRVTPGRTARDPDQVTGGRRGGRVSQPRSGRRPRRRRPRSSRRSSRRSGGGWRRPPAARRRPDRRDRHLVQVAGRVPEQVPLGRADQQRPLADGHRRVDADPEQPRLDLADVAPVPGRGQLLGRGPALPGRRHPLPLVGADDADPRAATAPRGTGWRRWRRSRPARWSHLSRIPRRSTKLGGACSPRRHTRRWVTTGSPTRCSGTGPTWC